MSKPFRYDDCPFCTLACDGKCEAFGSAVAKAHTRAWASQGGKKANEGRSPERRAEIGRLGAAKRWLNHTPKRKNPKHKTLGGNLAAAAKRNEKGSCAEPTQCADSTP